MTILIRPQSLNIVLSGRITTNLVDFDPATPPARNSFVEPNCTAAEQPYLYLKGVLFTPIFASLSVTEIETLIDRAKRQSSPEDPGARNASNLVEVRRVTPDIVIDLKYAGTDNFLGHALYGGTQAVIQEPVARALKGVQAELQLHGMGFRL